MFLTRSLAQGGSERQLVALAKALRKRGHGVSVAAMYSGGYFVRELNRHGVPVLDLAKRGRWEVFGFLVRFLSAVREEKPLVLLSYIVMPNLLACLVKIFNPRTMIVWGLRGSRTKSQHQDWLASLAAGVEKRLSWVPSLIITNSQEGMRVAKERGIKKEKLLVIENGIDSDRFCPDASERDSLRGKWGVPSSAHLVGLVGRLDPIKGHETFLRAAAKLVSERDDVRFVCVGEGPSEYEQKLKGVAADLGIGEIVVWAGACDDMRGVYNALDVLCSASDGEGFPNVVGEAMACGKACVVTNVGDSERIVGDCGLVVPPGDPDRLSTALHTALSNPSQIDAKAIRERIVSQFSVTQLAERTEYALYKLAGY